MRNLRYLDEHRNKELEEILFGGAGNEYNGIFTVRVGAKWFRLIEYINGADED